MAIHEYIPLFIYYEKNIANFLMSKIISRGILISENRQVWQIEGHVNIYLGAIIDVPPFPFIIIVHHAINKPGCLSFTF